MKPEQTMVQEIPRAHWQSPRWKKLKNKNLNTKIDIDISQLDPNEFDSEFASYKACKHCKGEGVLERNCGQYASICPLCNGNTAFGVSPHETRAWPGTKEKVAILAARYAEGLPLHREDDIKVGVQDLSCILEAV